jgi:hypothetical protein
MQSMRQLVSRRVPGSVGSARTGRRAERSKTCAGRLARGGANLSRVAAAKAGAVAVAAERRCSNVAQGIPASWRALLHGVATLWLGVAGTACLACPGPQWPIERVANDTWLARGAAGDADAGNRGRVSNVVAVRDGKRVWLLGSGPSPQSGRSLACRLEEAIGQPVTDLVAPWARPELVLGASAFGHARLWAHADVALAMQRQCPRCVERLRERLGAAAADLGSAPVRVPKRLLHGAAGQLGPFRWWRLHRSPQVAVTMWRLDAQPLWIAHGLLWGDGPPDAREADVARLAASTRRLATRMARDGEAVRIVPEQGPVLDASAPAAQAAYWVRLVDAADAAVRAGGSATDPAPPGLSANAQWDTHPRHVLNWQRVWRQAEDRAFERLPAARPSAASGRGTDTRRD